MVNICVIALVGLPASGKTTFCKTFLESSKQFECIHMCYDEMFTFVPECSEVVFRNERRKVLDKINQTIDCIKLNKLPTDDENCKASIIFCDDNNYYAGMRYEIYKICKENQISFGQIYFPIDIEDALLRNSMRCSGVLPASVIKRMNRRLEIPSQKNQWETNTFNMKSCFDLKKLLNFLQICLANPIKVVSENKELVHEPNVTHEIDKMLRNRIKELLQSTKGDIAERAKLLNDKRKLIMLDIKQKKYACEADLDVNAVLEQLLIE